MIREIDLVSYLPSFMDEFKETSSALEAENPELALVWNAADRALRNEFIESSDEYGISRLEKMLGIFPAPQESLDSRKFKVQNRYLNAIPYTLKALILKLITLCGGENFTITKDYMNYRIKIETDLELYGQVEELSRVIDGMIPCNMVVISENMAFYDPRGQQFFAGGVAYADTIFLTNDGDDYSTVQSTHWFGGGTIIAEFISAVN